MGMNRAQGLGQQVESSSRPWRCGLFQGSSASPLASCIISERTLGPRIGKVMGP